MRKKARTLLVEQGGKVMSERGKFAKVRRCFRRKKKTKESVWDVQERKVIVEVWVSSMF